MRIYWFDFRSSYCEDARMVGWKMNWMKEGKLQTPRSSILSSKILVRTNSNDSLSKLWNCIIDWRWFTFDFARRRKLWANRYRRMTIGKYPWMDECKMSTLWCWCKERIKYYARMGWIKLVLDQIYGSA